MNHKHREIALHSPEQQRKFFVEAKELGFSTKEVKERAKKAFKTNCFNDLTKSNLIWLIEQLVDKRLEIEKQ